MIVWIFWSYIIQDIQKNKIDLLDPTSLADWILQGLNGFNPGNMLKHSAWHIIGMIWMLLIFFCIVTLCFHTLRTRIPEYEIRALHLHLQSKKGEYVKPTPSYLALHLALSQGDFGSALQVILWLLPLNGLHNAHDFSLCLARETAL